MNNATPLWLRHFVLFIFMLFLSVKALEGPIRFILVKLGVGWLIYIPTILLFIGIILYFLMEIYKGRISSYLFSVIIIFFIACGIGILFIKNSLQVLFGSYVFIPLLFGLLMGDKVIPQIGKLYYFFLFLWIISVTGVILDCFIDWPWEGFEYEIGDITIEGARQWTAFGFERLAGFTRASFEAAIIIFIISLMLINYCEKKLLKTIFWLFGAIVIFLTTTKGIIAAYIGVTILMLIYKIIPRQILKLLPYVTAALIIIFPMYSWFNTVSLDLNDDIDRILLSSFEDRLTNVWPDAYNLVKNYGSSVIGRGIGGMGAAQKLFEWVMYNPADNLFVYLFGVFGFFSMPIILFFANRISLFLETDNQGAKLAYLLGMGIFVYGLTTNVIESPYMGLFLGFVAGFRNKLKNQS